MEGFNIVYKEKELVIAVKNNKEKAKMIESDSDTDNEKRREEDFMDYWYSAPTPKFNPNTSEPKCSNCAIKTYLTFSAAKADAVRRKIIDAPREEIRRCIIEKLGSSAWDYHTKAEFLNQGYKGKIA
ncbi:hypothetical protein OUZ56_011758 [Daphnia magna]|uniref:Uncharacterized protein n=1 Tax=Daphnia magna TaxID=35525 RepID=A0ABQ9Z120_9CRUS|nr:hypothetical protein OUZ56_011758 [Daphnia magna]